MPYEHSLSKPFIAPIFIEEDGYWQNCMKPYLEREGWYIAEVDCAGVVDARDFGRRLLTALDFDWDSFLHEFDTEWAYEYATAVDWLDLRQGLFVYYKNFEDVLSMADRLGNDSYAIYAVKIIDSMRLNYPMRPSPYPRSGDDYEVTLGYGFGVSRASLPRVEQFFTGNNEILIAGPRWWSIRGLGMRSGRKNISLRGSRLLGVMSRGSGFLILKGTQRVPRTRVMQDIP